jgi:hypothetical protein
MRTEMDVLMLENYLFLKSDQAEWMEKEDWKKSIEPD